METNGRHLDSSKDTGILRWSGRLLTAEDLRTHLNGHQEVVLPLRTIITPLAVEQLRTRGVRITRGGTATGKDVSPSVVTASRRDGEGDWAFAQDRPYPLVTSAVEAVKRDGMFLKELPAEENSLACRWSLAIAECIARGECLGGVVFCSDPGLFCCVANKVAGLRAVPVITVAQAARATLTLGANLAAVEMPGRTFFEVRQILRTVCRPGNAACPDGVACTLQELDGHAHR